MTSNIAAVVGVAQVIQRPDGVPLDKAKGPIELMVEAARRAADDAGAPGLLTDVEWIGAAGGWFRYTNPAQLVAQAIGAPLAATAFASVSGTSPQDMVALAAKRIADGELRVALIVGGEARWSAKRLKQRGDTPPWTLDLGEGTPEAIGPMPPEMTVEPQTYGGAAPLYALFEDRLRHVAGRTVDDQSEVAAQLWAGFSDVAADNPFAWDRVGHTAAEIRAVTPNNRMISTPYTKSMVANNTVDMSSAILLCHPDVAVRAGVERDRMVYPLVVASANETSLLTHRRELDESAALAATAHAVFERTGLRPHEIAHVDLYACFPSIVQMSRVALGLAADRPLTVTGGLGFAGAPVGNAAGQSIAAMVQRVRGGGLGLVHANGGMATKQSVAIYAGEPPAAFERLDLQDRIDLAPRTAIDTATITDRQLDVVVEAATVVFGRDAPDHVLATVLDQNGRRGFGRTADPAAIETATLVGLVDRAGRLATDGELTLG